MIRTPSHVIATPGLADTHHPLATSPATLDPVETVVPQVLDLVHLTGAIFFRSSFRAPWSYISPPTSELEGALPSGTGSLVMFHIVAEGRAWVAMNGTRHELGPGDLVVMPYGDAHAWGSDVPAEPVSIAAILPPPPWARLPHLRYGGDGAETKVVCGYLRGDAVLFDPVLRALPPLFVVHPDGAAATWVRASVEYAMADPLIRGPEDGPGADQRLAESLFSAALRIYLEERDDAELTGWLAALRQPYVGEALTRLHADPMHDWTVEELARALAVSRTVLVDAFVRSLGQPPIRYLTRWRLSLATAMLRQSDRTVGEVAEQVGYTSEAAFSRAFKRAFGVAPGHWRAGRR